MRFARTVTTTVAGDRLFDLLGHSDPHSDGILLQHSAGAVTYGTANGVPVTLAALETIVLPSTSTKSIWVAGGGDVTVALF